MNINGSHVAARKRKGKTMTATPTLSLTALEREILNHRLDAVDCIVEVIRDTNDYHEEDIAAVVGWLRDGEYAEAMDRLPEIAKLVLYDAVDGSTYYACSESACQDREITRAKLIAVQRAGHSLAAKVSEFIGERVRFPTA